MSNEFHQLLRTVAFAARAHDGQKRKDGKTPYVSHVVRVALILRECFGVGDPEILQTALLHDTIEDTTTDFDDIAREFSPTVASWVAALTKDKRLREDAREDDYLAALRAAPWQVHLCKLADVYDNLLDSEHFDPARRATNLKRVRFYLEGFADAEHSEVRRCWRIVDQFLRERTGS